MTFAIVAEMPLGTYRGSGQDGRPERWPSIVRLHSALLCAAGFGPRAIPRDGGDLGPCDADEVALTWLEKNPPDGVQLPAIEFAAGRVFAYRADGTLKKSKSRTTTKTLPKHPDAGGAVAGPFIWTWRDGPPPAIREAFEALCREVPYLGTTESPVRLTTLSEDVEVNHERDPDAGMFSVGTIPVDTPAPGRMAELSTAHAATAGRPPTISKDKAGTDESSLSEAPPRAEIASIRYRSRYRESVDVPWSEVALLPLGRHIRAADRVAWAVAAHRALIRMIGDGAPSLVTGVYPDNARKPSNRVAIHILDEHMSFLDGTSSRGTLAVLVPRGAHPDDKAVVYRALASLTSLRRGRIRIDAHPEQMTLVDGARFWTPPAPGQMRLWQTVPAAVPDTRGSRGQEWTFTHAALLSLGFVWKDQLDLPAGRGNERHPNIAAAVADRGAAIVHVSALRTVDVSRYVHRVNTHAVVRPYRAVVWLGALTGPGTILAIGQSRHLGGGLLVPLDVPEGIDASDVSLRPGWREGRS